MPSAPGRQDELGAEGLEQPAPLHAHALGHGHVQLVAARRADEGQADAGVAAGRLDDDACPGLILPSRSAASIIATPMRSLTLSRVEELQLGHDVAARAVASRGGGGPAACCRSAG